MSMFGPGPFSRDRRPYPLQYEAQPYSPAIASFFNAVYAWMAAGLALTAVVAWWVFSHPEVMRHVFSGGTLALIIIAQLVLVMVLSIAVQRISATAATVLFMLYAALNGLTLSAIFLVYALSSIAGAFIASAAMFGVMSVYGMLTRTDLTGLGKLCFMGLIGIIIASVVNMFLANSALSWIVSYAGVAIFVGLTAYDTQRLRQIAYSTAGDAALAARLSVVGALMLYLDFLNLFLFLLQIMGNRRR
jgi:FtsH-binding integral membrane protein